MLLVVLCGLLVVLCGWCCVVGAVLVLCAWWAGGVVLSVVLLIFWWCVDDHGVMISCRCGCVGGAPSATQQEPEVLQVSHLPRKKESKTGRPKSRIAPNIPGLP